MYYQALSNIIEYDNELVIRYDEWLALKSEEIITIEKLAKAIEIDFFMARGILELSCKLGVLTRMCAIKCPNCNHVISITSFDELYDSIARIEGCDACEEDGIEITDDEIQIIYKKKVKLNINNDEEVKQNLDTKLNEISQINTLKKYLDSGVINTNDIFFNPTEKEKNLLKILFERIGTKANNTTEQGDQLRLFMQELLKTVKVFESANIRTKTNEIDCEVKNKLHISYPMFLNDISSSFTVECKNENSKPDNTYFMKLLGIVRLAGQNCGILVSIREAASTFTNLQNKTFLKEEIFIINITYEELKSVVYDGVNFLDLFENKILSVRLDATTDFEKNNIFKK